MGKKRYHGLTDKEWLFCYEYLRTGSETKALERSYLEEMRKPTPPGRSRKLYLAKRILARPRVQVALDQMRREMRASGRVTLEQHLATLDELRDASVDAGQFAAAVRAEELRGRALGFYWEQHLIRDERAVSKNELLDRLKTLAQAHPRILEVMAPAIRQAVEGQAPKQIVATQEAKEVSPSGEA